MVDLLNYGLFVLCNNLNMLQHHVQCTAAATALQIYYRAYIFILKDGLYEAI